MTVKELRQRLVMHYASDPAKATLVNYYSDVLASVLDGFDGLGYKLVVEAAGDLPSAPRAIAFNEWQRRFVVPDTIEGAMAIILGWGPHPPTQAVADAMRPEDNERIKDTPSG